MPVSSTRSVISRASPSSRNVTCPPAGVNLTALLPRCSTSCRHLVAVGVHPASAVVAATLRLTWPACPTGSSSAYDLLHDLGQVNRLAAQAQVSGIETAQVEDRLDEAGQPLVSSLMTWRNREILLAVEALGGLPAWRRRRRGWR